MSNNFLQSIDQIDALGRFGQSSFKAGQLDRETKDAIRKEIFSFLVRSKESEKENSKGSETNKKITLSESLDQSRSMLEDYIHDFGNPKMVPHVHFDYTDNIGTLIKAVDVFGRAANDKREKSILVEIEELLEIEGLTLSAIISILSDEWIRIASKILRLSFQVREPPLQLPSSNNLRPTESKGQFD